MVSPAQQKTAVAHVVAQRLCSVRRACRYLGMARSTYRYMPKPGPNRREQLYQRIVDLGDETFVRAVYRTALGRDPSPDDLSFRLQELAMGKDREVFVNEVFASEESNTRRLYRTLDRASEIGHSE